MFDPKLVVGQILTEREVYECFQCQTTLGIRMSKKNNLFVIMSCSVQNNTYDDKWIGNTLLYNGTDINSDDNKGQTLRKGKGNNNQQLCDVWKAPEDSKPQIFLFVKEKKNQCIFKGEVYLSKEPYQAPRHDDPSKKVWIFPLTLCNVNDDKNQLHFKKAERAAYQLSMDQLYDKVKEKASSRKQIESTRKHTASSTIYERDPEIAIYAKRRAAARCDLCGMEAPFKDEDGHPYLEAHHIVWLSEGGADEIDNVVALCPNCHRKMHVVADVDDVKSLNEAIVQYNTMQSVK